MNWLERLIIKKKAEGEVDSAIKRSNMSPQMKHWLIGATNVVLSAAATAAGSLVAHTTAKQSLEIVGFAVIMSFGKWFVQNPIPDQEQK